MMTPRQCIKVAENVWGLVKHKALSYTWTLPADAEVPVKYLVTVKTWTRRQLVREVNSWSGFGRTVEAMRQNKKAWPWFLVNLQDAMFYADCIEKTHLAALEAMEEK